MYNNPELSFDISLLTKDMSDELCRSFAKEVSKHKWYCQFNGYELKCDKFRRPISVPKALLERLSKPGVYQCTVYAITKKKPPILVLSQATFVNDIPKTPGSVFSPSGSTRRIPAQPFTASASAPKPKTFVKKLEVRPAITFKELGSFTKSTSVINIYIDEVWPASSQENWIGGIGGIVWAGEHPEQSILQFVPTHLRERQNKKQAISQVVADMVSCPRALPFVFPFYTDNNEIPKDKYWQLVVNSIAILLGWLLPSDGTHCLVNVYLERFDETTFTVGTNKTAQFSGIQTALALSNSSGRFSRWTINKVEWVEKDFEYVPYGDAISYVIHDNDDSKELFEELKIRELPGYIPMSLELLAILRDLDVTSADGFIDTLIRFATLKRIRYTKLFRIVMNQAIVRAKNNMDFRDALLVKLENAYVQKTRNLPVLSSIAIPLLGAFSIDDFRDYPRQQIIRVLIELQDANHNGDPVQITKCVEKYEQLKSKLVEIDSVLCVEADLNLAVHYNDMFDFAHGHLLVETWLQKDLSLLPIEQRAKLHSSLGQSFAFEGNFVEADKEFDNAIHLFALGGKSFIDEIDQTSVYRAMNALDDAENKQAINLAEKVFGASIEEAVRELVDNTQRPYHHHLLVKLLWAIPELQKERELYLSLCDKWRTARQHPWELILFYRALICWEDHSPNAEDCFAKIDEIYDTMRHGSILDLIFCFIKTCQLVFCECDNSDCNHLLESMNRIKQELPYTSHSVNTMCEILSENQAERWSDFLTLLPFNYK